MPDRPTKRGRRRRRKTNSGACPLAGMRRLRARTGVFLAGDSRLWETPCGRYRARYIRRVSGVRVPRHWTITAREGCTIYLRGTETIEHLISQHWTDGAVARQLARLLRGDAAARKPTFPSTTE